MSGDAVNVSLIVIRAIHFAATAITAGVLIFRALVAESALDSAGAARVVVGEAAHESGSENSEDRDHPDPPRRQVPQRHENPRLATNSTDGPDCRLPRESRSSDRRALILRGAGRRHR